MNQKTTTTKATKTSAGNLFCSITTLIPFGIILILDQLTKYIIEKTTPNLTFIFLKIHLIYNTGAGFGILQNNPIPLGLLSLAVAITIIYNLPKLATTKYTQILWAIFLGGVIGNMLDRFIKLRVVDFIDFGWFPAFNIADAALTISTALLIIYYIKNEK